MFCGKLRSFCLASCKPWTTTAVVCGQLRSPEPENQRRTRFAKYAGRLRTRFGQGQRLALVERMWSVAFSDVAIGHHEERLMHLAGELLGLRKTDLLEIRARLQARPEP